MSSPSSDAQLQSSPLLYADPNHKNLMESFRSRGYPGLLREMKVLDQRLAPLPQASSLLVLSYEPEYLLMLIASVPTSALEALLDGKLLQKLINDPTWDDERHLVVHVPKSRLSSDDLDPGCYVNLLARHDGSPLTIDEFEEVLFAMEVCVGIKADSDKKFLRGTVTVEEGVEDVYHGNSAVRGSLVTSSNLSLLRTAVSSFALANRCLKYGDADTGVSPTHIPFPAEAGFTMRLTPRLNGYKMMTNSPDLFTLANCVLQYLYPNQFTMHQLVIFRPFDAKTVSIGEVILHNLVGSYARPDLWGGEEAKDVSIGQWIGIQEELDSTKGVCALAKNNLTRQERESKDRAQEVEANLETKELERECRKLEAESRTAGLELEKATLEYEEECRKLEDIRGQKPDAGLARNANLVLDKTMLEKRLDSLQKKHDTAETMVTTLQEVNDSLEEDIAGLKDQIIKLEQDLEQTRQAKQPVERAADETGQDLKDQIIKLEQDLGQTRQSKQAVERAADEAGRDFNDQLGKKEQDFSKTLDEVRTLTGLTEEIKRVIVSAFMPLLFRFSVGHTINTMGDRILKRRYPLLTLATPRQAPRNEGVAWSLTVIDPGDFAEHRTRESWDGPGTLWIHACCTSGPSAAGELSKIMEHIMDVYNYMNDDELHVMLKATHQVVENLKKMAGLEEGTKWRMLLASLRCVELLIRMGMSSSANRHILQGYRDRIETARQQSRIDSLLIQAMLLWIDEALTDPSRMEGMIEVLVGSTWERMVTTDGRHLVFADDTGHILVVRPGVGDGVVIRYDTDTEVSLSFQGLDHHGLEFGVAMRRSAGGKPVYQETLWSDRNHENHRFVMGLDCTNTSQKMASTSGDCEKTVTTPNDALSFICSSLANQTIEYRVANSEPVFICSSISNQVFELLAEIIPKLPHNGNLRGRCEDAVNTMKAEVERIVEWVATSKRRSTTELKADELYQQEKRIAGRESYYKPHSSQSLPTTPPRHRESFWIQRAQKLEVKIFWFLLDDLEAYRETDAPRVAQRPLAGWFRSIFLARRLEDASELLETIGEKELVRKDKNLSEREAIVRQALLSELQEKDRELVGKGPPVAGKGPPVGGSEEAARKRVPEDRRSSDRQGGRCNQNRSRMDNEDEGA
ncbi:hypothetical protein B0A49_03086 [Cryomyces minteri]|uniref:Uncharacterized protein n=1 Tax=Cryomyces minteri TaxID=331657 RepID=A0A4U0XUI3_9PEZI|nr:hypothetical protein B0A49_03086 [Cryomyces minteri]